MQLKDIPGLASEKAHLIEAFHRNKVGHAQLFYGSSGNAALGLALAFAQYCACTGDKDEDSCGQCANCKQFTSLAYPDLNFSFPYAKVEGAPKDLTCEFYQSQWVAMLQKSPFFKLSEWLSHLDTERKQAIMTVHEAKRINKILSLKSYSGGKKFLVIWLPEYLRVEAANKLLKTLEEPTGDSMIFLITENIDQLLQTVISRCQKLFIPPPSKEEVKNYLVQQGVNPISAEECAVISDGDFIEALRIAQESERYTEYAKLFIQFMRACYGAQVVDIFKFVDTFSSQSTERQKEGLRFFLQSLQISFNMTVTGQKLIHPLFNRLDFNLEKFARFIHQSNAKISMERIEDAIYDISRSGNSKIVLSDLCFKFSNLLRMKAS
jgi:DNA polymerase-3 subunit delta'